MASKKTLVLVDEAYIDFTEQVSLSSLVMENENLIIAKTFSKIFGLAGARIGYAIGNSKIIQQLSGITILGKWEYKRSFGSGCIGFLERCIF
jgi:histidinol-phosphate aminotransferase